MPNLPFTTMTYRLYSIISIFLINIIMFNWHHQHSIFSLAIILWSLVPLFSLHYIIKQYEYFHNKVLIVIQSYSAWVLFFAWVSCVFLSITMPYIISIISKTNGHYISLYILSPAVTLFITTISAFATSLVIVMITRLLR